MNSFFLFLVLLLVSTFAHAHQAAAGIATYSALLKSIASCDNVDTGNPSSCLVSYFARTQFADDWEMMAATSCYSVPVPTNASVLGAAFAAMHYCHSIGEQVFEADAIDVATHYVTLIGAHSCWHDLCIHYIHPPSINNDENNTASDRMPLSNMIITSLIAGASFLAGAFLEAHCRAPDRLDHVGKITHSGIRMLTLSILGSPEVAAAVTTHSPSNMDGFGSDMDQSAG